MKPGKISFYDVFDFVVGRKLGSNEECREIQASSGLQICNLCILVDKAID